VNLIADVMDKVGKDGVITVEESKGLEFETEYVEGMQFDRGYISPYFITDPEHMEASIERALPPDLRQEDLCSNRHRPYPGEAGPGRPRELVIIAEDVDGEALATLVLNKLRGMLNVLPSRPPALAIAARPCCRTSLS
jgi:chaperonin GroEL